MKNQKKKKNTEENFPLDPYECPWCHHKCASLESLIQHFELVYILRDGKNTCTCDFGLILAEKGKLRTE